MSVRDAFKVQSVACGSLGSPFMERLMALCADRMEGDGRVFDTILNWQGDPSPSADSVPLRFAGALHALKLQGIALVEDYPPNQTSDAALWDAVVAACADHETHILDWLTRAPQTNEVRRSGVLLAGFAEVAARYPDQPVTLIELGASGGLNLWADHYVLRVPGAEIGKADSDVVLSPEWTGPLPPTALPAVATRSGVDLAPLDPNDPEDRLKFRAYIWADQPERHARTDAALTIAAAGKARIEQGDAAAGLEAALSATETPLTIVAHTVAWQYFPEETKVRATAAMAGSKTPIVQLGMETDGKTPGAAVTLTHWPEGRVEDLGRADFHGRWITWY